MLSLSYEFLLKTSIFATIGLLLFIWIYNYFTTTMCKSNMSMKNKTVLITGCNSGIGKETALDLANRGARVIMACRNVEAAENVKEYIVAETKTNNIVVRQLDLSSFKSIRKFAAEITRTEPKLDILIHNAGIANMFHKQTTEDGLELTMATNQYGPFLLTHLLIDLLKKSKHSRIIVVASELYRLSKLNLNNPNPVNGIPAYLYYVSKYANILFTQELARRLQGSGVTANCLHPGMIDTGIWRNVPFPFNLPLQLIVKGFFKTAKQGAQTSIYLAVSEEVNGVSGNYFSECQISSLSEAVKDMDVAKKYWEICEELVKLKPEDPKI